MNILINGGIGFIGHNLVRQLQKKKHKVTIVDNVRYPSLNLHQLNVLMKERLDSLLPGYLFLNGDIVDGQRQQLIFRDYKPSIVVHCAGSSSQEIIDKDPIYASRSMVEGLLRILEMSKSYKVKKFVYISSSMVYGNFVDGVKEDTTTQPTNAYGMYKQLAEFLVKDFCTKNKIKFTIIRPTTLYGPRDSNIRLIAKFFIAAKDNKKLIINGEAEKLDFTYIDDFIEGCLKAILSKNTDNKTYNISSGSSVSILDVANKIISLVGSGKINLAEKKIESPTSGSLDIGLAKQDFDFTPVVNIDEGLKTTYEWIRNSIFWSEPTV